MNQEETYKTRLKRRGHRNYIGGTDPEQWYANGRMQLHYLVSQGLESHHTFLDIACGSLRLGQFLIPMLDEGNYYGIDGERGLIDAGLQQEMKYDVVDIKKPHFASNYTFDFSFISKFDYAIAQSLFTHLTVEDIELCFENIVKIMHDTSKFYFTFHEGNRGNNPVVDSDPHENWRYSFEQLEASANKFGLKASYIGDWKHPRKQKLVVATL